MSCPTPSTASTTSPPLSETTDSYFTSPSATNEEGGSGSRSPYSSAASGSDGPGLRSPPEPVAAAPSSHISGGNKSIDLLARDFRKPAEPLDVAAQLAKRPLPRSLHSSLEAAASRRPAHSDDDAPEARARKLAEAKRQWTAWRGS